MNKVRPGAYIDFESVPRPLSNIGSRGVVTMALPMTWGAPGITELLSTDLLDGKSLKKIGLSAFDPESLVYRLALSGAYLAYIYRLDTGGVKASAMIGDLTATAKYAGTTGNSLEVTVIANGANFDVVTYFSGNEVDRRTAAGIADLTENDWIVFSGSGDLAESAGVNLTGGTNGTITAGAWANYFAAIGGYKTWNTMAVVSDDPALPPLAKAFVKGLREDVGRKVQAVVVGYPNADCEGIISVDQGFKTATETVEPKLFAAYVAGLTAGAAINQTLTYRSVEDATEIIGEKDEADIDDLLRSGHFLLTRKQDGVIVMERDINTFTSFAPDKGSEFSKNRVIRTIDGYATDIRRTFENYYIGKVNNDDTGRDIFKADVISYLNGLGKLSPPAIQNFDSSTDITISAGPEIDDVLLDLWIRPADAMEKLYNKVYLRVNSEEA
jgi:hypothetical protein